MGQVFVCGQDPVRPNGLPRVFTGHMGAWKVEEMPPPAEAIAQDSMTGGMPKRGPIALHGMDGLVLGSIDGVVMERCRVHGRDAAGAAAGDGTAVRSVA